MLLKILFVLSLQYLIDKALYGSILRSDPYLYSLVKRYASVATAGSCAGCGGPLLLSPLIEANKLVEARNAAKVDSALFMGRESYSGYLTVNKQYNSNLFFWYFPAPGTAAGETPLILWLQGGPGASSLYGLFVEIGPFYVNGSGHLEERVYSWGTNHSLLFIDNPVGTGFSFPDNDDDGYATNQTQIGSSLYFALQQFLTVFSELRPAPLFIAGESYAGKHIPSLGIQIHWHRKTDQAERPINLQGMSIGNGFIDPPRLMRHSFLLREVGLVDDATADILIQIEEMAGKYLQEGDTEMGLFTFLSGMGMSREVSGITNQYNFLSNTEGLANLRYVEFLQQHHIRKAIHVGNTTFDNLNKVVYMKLGLDILNSAKPWLEELLNHYRIMTYRCLLNAALCGTISRSDPYLRSLVKRYGTTADAGDCSGCGEPLLLTPLIEANKLGEARNAAKVDPALFMGRESYSGYLTVNKKYNSNLFFWYFPAPGRAAGETPLILWLQGGPGAASLYGLFDEIGPFRVNGGGQLEEMPHSWGTNHSLLFIDNPVGAGFSFTDHDDGYATNQTQIGSSLYFALQQFLTVFPELRPAPLFIAGESYAGKHIPSLGIQIHWHRKTDQAERPINLQGMAIGNGFVDPATLMRVSFLMREMGLIDDRRADMVRGMEEAAEKYLKEGETTMAFYTFMSALDVAFGSSGISNEYNVLSNKEGKDLRYVEFLQQHHIRKALHVGNTTFDNISMKVYVKVLDDVMNSAKPWMEELLNHYRIMTYNGHLDAKVPYHASVHTYNSLVFEGAAEYATAPRHVWRYPKAEVVAGYYKSAGRFLEVMVRGAGHMVPEDKPAEALALISAFALDQPLDSPGPKP